jgi:Spy/CpxP family protein refolding chaperone
MTMRYLMAFVLCAACATPLTAQDPPMRRQMLREQVMERFMGNLKVQAGLSDEQLQQVMEVFRDGVQFRSGLAERERDVWRAMEGQMRPGVAADADSVSRLLESVLQLREQVNAREREEQETLAEFLTPVQRAQVLMAWHRFQMQVERVRGGRGPMEGGRVGM